MNAPEKEIDKGPRIVGRYAIHEELAAGGMASVHLGRLLGEVGFARTVAIKKLHSQYARDPEFVAMFLDEARLVSRIKHPNVVPTLDIVSLDGELFLVMEYVHGEPLSRVMMALSRRKERMPVNIAVGICLGLLEGLHAAHEAKSEDGEPLGIVHRDVSPQNVIVGTDGIARVLDFGIAKAAKRIQTTEDGQFKGKLGYMPPDVLSGGRVDRRTDVWGASVVLWEMLVGRRLFVSDESPFALVKLIVENEVDPPSKRKVLAPPALDEVVLRGLKKNPDERFASAREMALALEAAVTPASSRAIGEWLQGIAADALAKRAARVEAVELASRPERLSPSAVQSLAATPPSRPQLPPIVDPVMPPSSGSGPLPPGALTPAPGSVPAYVPSSSFSTVAPNTPAPGKSGPIVALIVMAIAVFAIAVPAVVFLLAKRTTSVSTISTSSSAPPLAVSSTPTVGSIEPVPEPIASPSSVRSAAPVATTLSTPRVTGRTNAPAATPKCNPPYTIGPPPDYIRKPKLECLPK